uniref:Ribosomal protein L13 n=1 Tax=Panagrellus redivivus TaxID=6233 RepID=A0A7E4W2J2_PANRE
MATSGRFARVQQWLQFHRQWHVVDATHQDVYKLGQKVADNLSGRAKPIYHPETDCGDHVVIYNCADVAMKAFDWKHVRYLFNKEYPQSKNHIPAYEIHEYDPCRVMFMATYSALGNSLLRRTHIMRLHLFADDDIPERIRSNLGKQMELIQPVPRKSTEYTAEERANFPRLVQRSERHLLDWEKPVEMPTYVRDPRIKKKK